MNGNVFCHASKWNSIMSCDRTVMSLCKTDVVKTCRTHVTACIQNYCISHLLGTV